MSASDIAVMVAVPVVWLFGYSQYRPETRAMPVIRFWLRLTFAMTLLAVSATILRLLLSDAGNDQTDMILRIVRVAALMPIALWLILATVAGWSK
jgi:hypothetical protein